MKRQINALLQKQYLTGDAAGRLMILDLVAAYKSLTEDGDGTGVLTDAQKKDIVNNLVLPDEIQRFNDYRGLHDYLTSAPAIIESYIKTYEVYHQKLFHVFANMGHAEEESRRLRLRPVVMTQIQYTEFQLSGKPVPSGGIAVFQDMPKASPFLDENGFYIEPAETLMGEYTAEKILLKYSDFIKDAISGMKDMLAECLARKKALELLASYTKIPQIKLLIIPVNEDEIALINTFMSEVIESVRRDDPAKEKELKKSFEEISRPIDLKSLEPTADAIKKARRTLNFSVIKNNSEAYIASLKREWRNDC